MADTLTLLRQQFTDLCAQRDAILAVSGPLRAERDGLTKQAEAALAEQIAPYAEQIATAETGLPSIMNEIAQIANALNGQTAA